MSMWAFLESLWAAVESNPIAASGWLMVGGILLAQNARISHLEARPR